MQTPEQIKARAAMEALGWDFLPFGPSEWQWMKFDADGKRIAVQCDAIWRADCDACGIV